MRNKLNIFIIVFGGMLVVAFSNLKVNNWDKISILEVKNSALPDSAPAGFYISWQRTTPLNGNYSVIWINGQQYEIGTGWIEDITVFNDTIYSCGHYLYHDSVLHADFDRGFYMVGNRKVELPITGNPAESSKIWVDSSGIYVAGQDNSEPCYWLNGEKHILPYKVTYSEIEGGFANDICIRKGVVYCTGCRVPLGMIGCYWIDNERYDLSGSHSFAWAIDVDQADIYVAGYSENINSYGDACYWKNGEKHNLSLPVLSATHVSEATDLLIYKGDIYISGFYTENNLSDNRWHLCYWKNGVRTDIFPSVPQASKRPKISVDDTCVYLATDTNVWRRDIRIPINNETGRTVTSIFNYTKKAPVSTNINQKDTRIDDLIIYPNPTKGIIKISQKDVKFGWVSITDLNGKVMEKRQIHEKEESVNLSNLHSGLYLIKLQNEYSSKVFKIVLK